jgi:hypothetical protein
LYYYLTLDNSPTLVGKQAYKLTEWESNIYADCQQLNEITNSITKSNTIAALVNSGVNQCFVSNEISYASAFFDLEISAGQGQMTADSVHTLEKNECKILTTAITGIMASGYSYGISGNTAGLSNVRHTVPLFATSGTNFPGGFETGVVGLSAGRRVFVRNVLMAQTGIGSFVTNEMAIIANARDIH